MSYALTGRSPVNGLQSSADTPLPFLMTAAHENHQRTRKKSVSRRISMLMVLAQRSKTGGLLDAALECHEHATQAFTDA